MKKIAVMFLGLSVLLGTTSLFGFDSKTDTTKTTKTTKTKRVRTAKKTATSTEKKP